MSSPVRPKRQTWDRLKSMVAPRQWIYRDAHYLVADVDVDAAAARRWVPWPLRPAEPTRASIFTAWFPRTSFGSTYREAGLFLHVLHGRTRAVFSPWMIVDDDVALIAGRELLGYPKKMGTIEFRIDGDRVIAHAERRGAELVHMEAELLERVPDAPPMLGRPHRNVRSSLGFAVPKVIAFTPKEERVDVRRADVRLRVSGSERDPLDELGFGRVRSAYLYRVHLGGSLPPLPVASASPFWFWRHTLLRAH